MENKIVREKENNKGISSIVYNGMGSSAKK